MHIEAPIPGSRPPNAYSKRGDIVLTAGKGKLARLIRWGQRSLHFKKSFPFIGQEPPSRTNHMTGTVYSGWVYPNLRVSDQSLAFIVESDVKVRGGTLWEHHSGDDIWIFRPLNVPDWQLATICRRVEQKLGRPYSFLQLPAQLIDHKLFGGRAVLRWLFRFSPLDVCSRLWVEEFGRFGYHFGVPDFSATPDDAWDFAIAHPEKYGLVYGVLPEGCPLRSPEGRSH